MSLTLNEKFLNGFLSEEELASLDNEATAALDLVINRSGKGADYLGWVDLPIEYDREELLRIKAAAERIKNSCDVLIVLGIGGSYLGARAVIEFLKSPLYNSLSKDTPDIYFSGNSISSAALSELLTICEGKDICLNVISKSGTTTETAVAFRIFRDLLYKKYGKEGARDRIFVTTDRERGTLKHFSDESGFLTFVIPDDVGGRYSVLTAVGLLPIAVAGIDVDALLAGAAAGRQACLLNDFSKNPALRYASIRNALYRKGKVVEILVGYEPYALLFNEWWKQLFGESEGKDGKGILPDSVIFSTDLHSLGQYIQEGSRILFETVLSVKDSKAEVLIPNDPENIDGLNFLSGKPLSYVNNSAMLGTLLAHNDGGVPNVVVEIEGRDAYSLGYLIYFFELACAVSGYMLGVNPFDQPGVEAYKKNMFALLSKPGYEKMGENLRKRLDF